MAANNAEEISSKEVLEAQSHIWKHMFSFINSFCLKTAIELGIPDAIHNHGNPITLTELAATVSIPSCRVDHFRRLMAILVHNGFFTQATTGTNEPVYSLTTNSMLLVKEKGLSIAPIVEMVLYQPLVDPWQCLTQWLRSEQPASPFEMCKGSLLWDATGKMPELGKMMREGLDSDSGVVAHVILKDCADQFQGVKSLVEVAGNKGTIAQAIAKAHPQIKCSLLELPHVIDKIEKSNLIEYVAGDMFEHIPPADVLVLKWVMMTWDDEHCVKILKRCREAIPTQENGGKVIIIDKVMDAKPGGMHLPTLADVQIYFHMEMMVHVNGKQRTEAEWKKLFDEAGFKEYKIIPELGMRCIIEVYH